MITGGPEQVESDKGLSNLRRAVEWRTLDQPVDYADLPPSVAARLGNQNTVTDLTAELEILEGLLPEALDEEEPAKPEPVRELVLRDADDKLAEALLLSRDFLQEAVELLRDRKQIIRTARTCSSSTRSTGRTWPRCSGSSTSCWSTGTTTSA